MVKVVKKTNRHVLLKFILYSHSDCVILGFLEEWTGESVAVETTYVAVGKVEAWHDT